MTSWLMELLDLCGCHVVEMGVRQAWSFLGLGDADGRERRLYLDSTWDLDGHTHEATEAGAWLGLAEALTSATITRATVTDDGALVLVAESHRLTVSGEAASTPVVSRGGWDLSRTQGRRPQGHGPWGDGAAD